MDKWAYERDLKFDLLATQGRSGWQDRNLGKCARELLDGFDQCRPL
jgi:hypothetical protein